MSARVLTKETGSSRNPFEYSRPSPQHRLRIAIIHNPCPQNTHMSLSKVRNPTTVSATSREPYQMILEACQYTVARMRPRVWTTMRQGMPMQRALLFYT